MNTGLEDLLAIQKLQLLPALRNVDGTVSVQELDNRWHKLVEDNKDLRARIEPLAFSGMTIKELHLFFSRFGLFALQSWNNEQTVFGRIKNRLTVRFPGYAQVPGRVLLQVQKLSDLSSGEDKVPSTTYLLRADVALEIRDELKLQLESAE